MRVASIKKVYNFILVTLVSVTLCFTTCSLVVHAGNTEEVTAVLTPNWIYDLAIDHTNGKTDEDEMYSTTDYITIIDDAVYTVSIKATYANSVHAYFYDSNKNYLGNEHFWSMNTSEKSAVLTIPDNAAYFRLTAGTSNTSDSVNNAVVLSITLTETIIVATGKSVEELLEISINGYESDVMEDATNTFSSEADILHDVESDLMDTSNQYVNDYTSEAFDTSFLDTLGDSLIFVVTWFTNFWNMGGAFTSCLNFLFALSIVFYIVRIR